MKKIETIEEMKKKNLTFVTVESTDVKKIVSELKIDVMEQNDHMIKFKNSCSINRLIQTLSKYKIDKLLIEEATLEDMFLHYYM